MRIYLESDSHYESDLPCYGVPDEPVDLVVLAGDIHRATDSVRVASWYQRKAKTPVILLAGNHDYYGGDIETTLAEMRAAAAPIDDVYFLENDAVVIGDVRFLGCTLWTNFLLFGNDKFGFYRRHAVKYINDFSQIRNADRLLNAKDVIAKFDESYAWLERELSKPYPGKTVVVSHFAPHPEAIHQNFTDEGSDDLSPYFVPDCRPLIRKHDIDCWMYGHTHNSIDLVIEGKTRLVSNQAGYWRESEEFTRFDAFKVIVI